jgi:rhodanese-related sulfurtransferase
MTDSTTAPKHTEAFEKLVDEIRPHVKEIACQDVLEMQRQGKKFHFVDVREDHEWSEGHAIGAQHLGRGILERDIESVIPDYNAPLVLYCGGGYRSALAVHNIQKMGYTNVLSMAGGIRKWRELNLPEEK